MLVGIISDTHGLLRPSALERLKASQLIVHAGDVGDPEILEALSAIAPVIAVRGNIDSCEPLSRLPQTAIGEAGATLIYVLHNIADLDLNPAAAGFHMVVFGHSHKQELYVKAGVTYVNPGSAGPRRFRLPVSVASVDTNVHPMQVTFIQIEP